MRPKVSTKCTTRSRKLLLAIPPRIIWQLCLKFDRIRRLAEKAAAATITDPEAFLLEKLAIAEILQPLPWHQKHAVILCCGACFTQREAAALSGISLRTINYHLEAAIETLARVELAREGVGE